MPQARFQPTTYLELILMDNLAIAILFGGSRGQTCCRGTSTKLSIFLSLKPTNTSFGNILYQL